MPITAQMLAEAQKLQAARASGNYILGGNIGYVYNQQPDRQVSAIKGGQAYPQGQVLGLNTFGGSGQNTTQSQENTINQNAQDLQAQADFEFEQALSIIGQQEGAANQRATADIAAQETAGKSAELRAGEAKQRNLEGLANEQTTAENQASSGIRGARDLFRQIQQQNIAQLSGLGISSSSVAEALAEKLGVETARRIGGITGNLDEIRQNIAKEITNVGVVFQNKVQEIKDRTDVAIQSIRADLAAQLASLGAERGRAATAKAQMKTDIATKARNAIQQIQLESQQRQQSVADAAAKRQKALEEAEQFMFRPTDFTGISNAIQNIQSLPAVAGFNVQPTLTTQMVQGQPFVNVSGQYLPSKEKQNPYEQGTQDYDDWEMLNAL